MNSYIDLNKLNKIPQDTIFGYRDIVKDTLDNNEHSKYGEIFKSQVEEGLYNGIIIEKETDSRMLYRKQ